MQTTLRITVGAGTEVKVEVIGAQGSECLQLTDPLKEHGTVTDVVAKPEFYSQSQTTVGITVEPDVC